MYIIFQNSIFYLPWSLDIHTCTSILIIWKDFGKFRWFCQQWKLRACAGSPRKFGDESSRESRPPNRSAAFRLWKQMIYRNIRNIMVVFLKWSQQNIDRMSEHDQIHAAHENPPSDVRRKFPAARMTEIMSQEKAVALLGPMLLSSGWLGSRGLWLQSQISLCSIGKICWSPENR